MFITEIEKDGITYDLFLEFVDCHNSNIGTLKQELCYPSGDYVRYTKVIKITTSMSKRKAQYIIDSLTKDKSDLNDDIKRLKSKVKDIQGALSYISKI